MEHRINERFKAGMLCHCCHERRSAGTHYLVLPSYGIDTRGVHICWDCLRTELSKKGFDPRKAHCVCCPSGNSSRITHSVAVSKESNRRLMVSFCPSCRDELLLEIPSTAEEAMLVLNSNRQLIRETVHRLLGG